MFFLHGSRREERVCLPEQNQSVLRVRAVDYLLHAILSFMRLCMLYRIYASIRHFLAYRRLHSIHLVHISSLLRPLNEEQRVRDDQSHGFIQITQNNATQLTVLCIISPFFVLFILTPSL